MATRWEDVDVKCPFYLRFTEHHIICEGLQTSGAIALDLTKKEHLVDWMQMYCTTHYKLCPLYKMMEENYEE